MYFLEDTNDHDTLFGGKLLSIMDKAGGISCSKFAHREIRYYLNRYAEIRAPARQGDLLEVTGKVVYTSTHTACSKVTALAVNKATWEKKKFVKDTFSSLQ